MVSYADVCAWSQDFDVITNRIAVINQVLGSKCEGLSSNPCKLAYKSGRYYVSICDSPFIDFGIYDSSESKIASDCLDRVFDAIWLLNRSGRLQFT